MTISYQYKHKVVDILRRLTPILTGLISRTTVLDSKGKQSLLDDWTSFVSAFRSMLDRAAGKIDLPLDQQRALEKRRLKAHKKFYNNKK